MSVDKAERVANLVAYLLDVERPVSLRRIVEVVEGYPEAYESARVYFDRDRKMLASEGITITMTGEGDRARYRIDPASYYLPDLELDPDETAALNVATSAVRIEGSQGEDALLKLGATGAEGPALVSLPADPRLSVAYDAVRDHRRLTFTYAGAVRSLEPYGLLCRDGFWYLAGFDLDRGECRTFRLDRIDGGLVTASDAGAYVVPDDFDARHALPAQPFEMAPGSPVEALVRVDAVAARRAVSQLGERAVRHRHDDGSVVVALAVTNPAGLRSWLFGLLDHARLLEPPELVEETRAWLRSMA